MEADTQVPEEEDTTSRGQREEYEGKLKPKQMKREGEVISTWSDLRLISQEVFRNHLGHNHPRT